MWRLHTDDPYLRVTAALDEPAAPTLTTRRIAGRGVISEHRSVLNARTETLAVERLSKSHRQRPLPHAQRPANQVRVADTPMLDRATQEIDGPLVTDDPPGILIGHADYMPVSGGGWMRRSFATARTP